MAEILNIKKALERRLSQVAGSIPTAYEGVEFNPPVNAMYQRTQIVINRPRDPSFQLVITEKKCSSKCSYVTLKGKVLLEH